MFCVGTNEEMGKHASLFSAWQQSFFLNRKFRETSVSEISENRGRGSFKTFSGILPRDLKALPGMTLQVTSTSE